MANEITKVKHGFCQSWEGNIILNQPKESFPQGIRETGNYQIDFYGCWHEVKCIETGKRVFMIGGYPEHYFVK